MIRIYLTIIFELFIQASIIITISYYLNQSSFFYHCLICLFFIIVSVTGSLIRNEDYINEQNPGRRYFMSLGHATVWAFFVGTLILFI